MTKVEAIFMPLKIKKQSVIGPFNNKYQAE